MYRIRAFGNNRECHSVEELQDCLGNDFRGQSVSVVYPTAPHGMLKTHFIDVLSNGQAMASYGDQAPFDYAAIKADILSA